jgi:hypothetical protein
MISLTAPDSDVAATDGTTLGGKKIDNKGSWQGNWTDLQADQPSSFGTQIPPASAQILRLVAM